MCPFTCGAIPTKLARTVASSVCGLVCHWSSATIMAMAAATTIPAPITRPRVRRAPGSDARSFSAIKLTSEESHPECESNENGETRINKRRRTDIRIEAGPDKKPPAKQSCPNSDQGAEHPGRKERTDDVDLGSHYALLCCSGFRVPTWNLEL